MKEKYDEFVKLLSLFSFSSTKKTAGKSPSLPGSLDGVKYQVKRSNSTKNWRRWFGYDPNPSDLVGEFIASKVARELSHSIFASHELSKEAELSPEIELVLDEKKRELKLASRYLNYGSSNFLGATLDEVWQNSLNMNETHKGHSIISADGSSLPSDSHSKLIMCDQSLRTKLCGEEVKITIKPKEIFQAIKLSFLLGDHDINPGNMYLVYDKSTKKSQICRIDYGHAFGDLVKKWGRGRDHSPSIASGRGLVLDAFNRTKINGGISKLSRDYRGLVPNHEFATILRTEIDNNALTHGVEQSKSEMREFYSHNGSKLGKLKKFITKSFTTLSSRMGFSKPEKKDEVLESVNSYVRSNAEEMKSVANLMDVQAYIEDVANNRISPEESAKKIQTILANDERYLQNKSLDDTVEWLRKDGEKIAPKCSINEYISATSSKYHNQNSKENLDALSKALAKLSIGIAKQKESLGKYTSAILKSDPPIISIEKL